MDGVRVRESSRAKRVTLKVHFDGLCEVVIPLKRRASLKAVARFVDTHKDWIATQKARLQKKTVTPVVPPAGQEKITTEATRVLVLNLVKELTDLHGFKVCGVKFKVYTTRWGSCSSDCKLQFHAYLSLLPIELIKYVVIHELAHTVHHHHQASFWKLVSQIDPEYLEHRRQLRKFACVPKHNHTTVV